MGNECLRVNVASNLDTYGTYDHTYVIYQGEEGM